jgi:GNAT superfamily N-acetyltransferase
MGKAAHAVEQMTREDWDRSHALLAEFWGPEEAQRVGELQHPLFWLHFQSWAFVIREAQEVVAYMVACELPRGEERVAYSHLVAVLPSHRNQGYGRALYAHLEERARARGCVAICAMTSPSNERSITFHRTLGFTATLAEDLWRPGKSRTFFEKPLRY